MAGVTTVYIAGIYEFIENGTTDKVTKYYEGNALRRSGYGVDDGVFYLLQDHLKSSSSFVNQSGTTLSTNYYLPYGGNRGAAFSSLSTKRFTGQYHESGLPGGEGLSYYNARWYDAKLGRFLSADTIVPGPANPQAFNRYSYGFNNPLRFNDPTGHDPCDNGGRCDGLSGGGGSRPRPRPSSGSSSRGSERGIGVNRSIQWEDVVRVAKRFTQQMHKLYQDRVAPDFYLRGVGGNVTVGQGSVEMVFDASTNQFAMFYVYGIVGGTDSLAANANVYAGHGWKGNKRDLSIAAAYSGDSMGVTLGVGKAPLGVSGAGGVGGRTENGIFFPDWPGVKTVTGAGSVGFDPVMPFWDADISFTTYVPIGKPVNFPSDGHFYLFTQFAPG